MHHGDECDEVIGFRDQVHRQKICLCHACVGQHGRTHLSLPDRQFVSIYARYMPGDLGQAQTFSTSHIQNVTMEPLGDPYDHRVVGRVVVPIVQDLSLSRCLQLGARRRKSPTLATQSDTDRLRPTTVPDRAKRAGCRPKRGADFRGSSPSIWSAFHR